MTLAFQLFERLNGLFDPTQNSQGPISQKEARQRERDFFNPPRRREEPRSVGMYCLPLSGGAPGLLKHYMHSYGPLDAPLNNKGQHLLHYAMDVGTEFALDAHRTIDSFQRGLTECTRIVAQNSRNVLEPQNSGETLATAAFNFTGAIKEKRPVNAGARAEVVLATLYNQLFRKTGRYQTSKPDPQLPLFRPPQHQPDQASSEAHYHVHNHVAIRLCHPADACARQIVEAGQRLDPQGLAFWKAVPPPPGKPALA